MPGTTFRTFTAIAITAFGLAACAPEEAPVPPDYDAFAEQYVKLVLAVGAHDANFVDAYYGPEAWRTEATANKTGIAELKAEAAALMEQITALPAAGDGMTAARRNYQIKQLRAVHTRLRMLDGETLAFDEETALLYDATAPDRDLTYYDAILDEISALIPGDAPLSDRVNAFRSQFVIPEDRLDAVMTAALDGCRARTMEHITLPDGERFTLEYVKDKPWSGYNWYQGNAYSLIQINTDFPIYLDRAVDLGCHEGYPGHHTYNALLETSLVNERGWVEFSVYPLFSPQSLIAEGTANLGIEMAFPGTARMEFERDVLFPAAGLDPTLTDAYFEFRELSGDLAFSRNEIARDYLNGDISREEAIALSQKYGMTSFERAEQSVSFIETYRGYVINYNLGAEMARDYVTRHGGDSQDGRWKAYADLLASPRLPSDLLE